MQTSSLNKRQSKGTFHLSQICGKSPGRDAEAQSQNYKLRRLISCGDAPRILSPSFECKASRGRGEEVELFTSFVEYMKQPVRDHFFVEKETDPLIQHFSAWRCVIQDCGSLVVSGYQGSCLVSILPHSSVLVDNIHGLSVVPQVPPVKGLLIAFWDTSCIFLT